MDTSQELQQKPKGRGYRGGNMREGEIVQVQGGHIIRATGRKDRHSKVFTAKGPRDRRVRLSAHTAIQFYDVQDRLGYDRPSKAVDWLMKKAKSAIDKLDVLPPFNPSAIVELGQTDLVNRDESESSRFEIGHFHPPTTAETMKSFFPSSSTTNPMGFHGYPHQDLCLSLQSFQNPGLVHSQSDPGNPNSNQALYPVEYETGNSSGWTPESNMNEMGQFSRLLAWSGGTLQSNFHPQPSIRAWDDLPMSSTNADHQNRIPKVEGMQQMQNGDGFMGFEDMHGINLSYNHNSASSMSTDSSR